ncbi:MAG: SIS domain-containing protein [Sediminibacterium sp.]|nr:SIS domain-containing protein [Sediminibacterium sp.]
MNNNFISNIINESIQVKNIILNSPQLISAIEHSAKVISNALKNEHRIYFCGNGGSAADAQHLAAELSGRFYIDRKALPAEALHCNTSYVTAVANDYSYDVIYARLLEGIAKKGDVLIALSTSGNSKNILKALDICAEKNIYSIGLTGESGGEMKHKVDTLINVPSTITPRIQESHILIGHIICEMVENSLF